MFQGLTRNAKDTLAGLLFAALGLGFSIIAYLQLPIGTATRMGPGYFPIVLGGLLVLFGAAIVLRGAATREVSVFGIIPWRGIVFTAAALILFATTLGGLGIALAVFFASIVGSLASARVTVIQSLVTAIVLSVMCAVIFGEWLNLSVPVFGSWVRVW